MSTDNDSSGDLMSDHIKKFLKEPPLLLKNFHYEDVLEFLELGIEERFQSDDIILNESEYVNSAYLVAEGKVAIWKDNIQLATLSDGNFLGEAFLFSKNNRMAKVTAEGNCVLLRYERYEALNFFRKKPEKLFNIFTKNIIEIQQRKISNMNVQLLNLKKRLLNDSNW
ncbi:MAG: cyclic nucleotide-binding domain-containing protein [Balneolaceae bacterium]|nr:cyclic nucleotide-binding domain-containing protein [Balneolaceae bacterium]MBO6546161.1 cyclic nucleotide-binding domain-containing protein [Balneolaceae bacterium]MBO6648519.1 cyclic nucleotide-binding domain-containing protein [Balneolaceae bacterium]